MKITLLLLGMACPYIAFSQSEEDIRILQWQSLHPSTLLIEQSRFDALSKDQKKLLGDNYVLFNTKITLDQLEAFDALVADKAIKENSGIKLTPSDAQYIKDWLGTHQQVKIEVRSEYETLTEEEKATHVYPEYLVLEGEFITSADILNYETH